MCDAISLNASVFYEKSNGTHGRTDVQVEAATSESANLRTFRGYELAQLDRGTELRRAALIRHRFFAAHQELEDFDWAYPLVVRSSLPESEYLQRVLLERVR